MGILSWVFSRRLMWCPLFKKSLWGCSMGKEYLCQGCSLLFSPSEAQIIMIRKGLKVWGMAWVCHYYYYYCCCYSRLRPGVASGVLQGKKQALGESNRISGFTGPHSLFWGSLRTSMHPIQSLDGGVYLLTLQCWWGTRTNLQNKYLLLGIGMIFKNIYKLNFHYVSNAHCRKILTYFAGNVYCRKFSRANMWKRRN